MSEFGTISARWVPASQHSAADALSRNPIEHPNEDDECGEDATTSCIQSIVISELKAHDVDISLKEVREAAAADHEFQLLAEVIRNGFPDSKSEVPEAVKRYWPVRDRLTVDDGIVLCGCRVVIPPSLRKRTLATLHAGHLGRERTISRARQIVYWPGMNADVDHVTKSCDRCQSELPSQQRETLIQHELPGRPFQHLTVDIGSHAGGADWTRTPGREGSSNTGTRPVAAECRQLSSCTDDRSETLCHHTLISTNGSPLRSSLTDGRSAVVKLRSATTAEHGISPSSQSEPMYGCKTSAPAGGRGAAQ
ncbi:uncharacterized protein K02A2.6-like [Amphibalanus amphitrite]|uniref:uncharacterized protein K02A2.6-like n=1 Tax=Amphibalanus amphitrite TaxID=1232801 RepID=UPI001C927F1E|nr:uncharacterized protein K02A2.6-like [Amphibalanus amphitrite]